MQERLSRRARLLAVTVAHHNSGEESITIAERGAFRMLYTQKRVPTRGPALTPITLLYYNLLISVSSHVRRAESDERIVAIA
jgi:hypothetical protein